MIMADNASFFESQDGLKLYYRDFGAENTGTPVICLPGLTRNSRDFEDLANYLSDRRRVITCDFRGRGYSEYDENWENYHPLTYVQDTWTLLDHLGIDKIIVVGTSLGGLCAMVMATTQGERVAGVVMNDIGPEINPAGIERVREYTGRVPPVSSWDEAAEQSKEIYGDWLPGLSDEDWKKMAWRAYRENEKGVPHLDMDPNIGEAVRKVGAQKGDPWALFDSFKDKPVTLLWGVMYDIMTKKIIDKMIDKNKNLNIVSLTNRWNEPLKD